MSSPDELLPETRPSPLIERLTRPFQRFAELEASSSIVLLVFTVVALLWANSPFAASYAELKELHFGVSAGSLGLSLPLEQWVNDALMAIFFFVVGMEIKREFVKGELSSRARAMLPVIAALGGMIAPALIYSFFNAGGPAAHGWGIPMATDIAFAVAALAVFGSRVPPGLRVFLLALAIADDLGAVTVIAIFYTTHLAFGWLLLAALALAVTFMLNVAGVRSYGVYLIVGAFAWLAMLHSGVHATVSGVALGFLTPASPLDPRRETLVQRAIHRLERFLHGDEEREDLGHEERHRLIQEIQEVREATLSPLDHLSGMLQPWVAYAIMPIFAFVNAGVAFKPATLEDPMARQVGLAVALGLVVGKPIGITLFSYLSVRLRLAELPRGVNWRSLFGAGVLGGIGFTVALFVTALAFKHPDYTDGSKIGILVGSSVATLLGTLYLSRVLPPRPSKEPAAGG